MPARLHSIRRGRLTPDLVPDFAISRITIIVSGANGPDLSWAQSQLASNGVKFRLLQEIWLTKAIMASKR